MRVAIGILCGVTGGPATYGRRLVEALAACGATPAVITDRPAAFEDIAGLDIVDVPMRGGIDRLRWQHVALPRAIRRSGCEVYHDTKNALPRRLRVPAVVTVHDLAYYRVPETFGALSRLFLRRATSDAVRRARRVVVPSRATALDVAEIFPAAAGKVRVIPHGIDPPAAVSEAELKATLELHGIRRPYVLHVGTLQARKNVDLLVRAMRALRAEGIAHHLVVAGRRGWLADRALAEIDRGDTAVWLGEVPPGDLAALYRGADAFCSPSAYEGFGFAVADALAAGIPVAVANRSSLPEVCGTACVTIDELSADAVADALRPLLTDPELRARLGEAGRQRAAEFTWDRSARAHLEAYADARAVG